jgi:hypothetical protein
METTASHHRASRAQYASSSTLAALSAPRHLLGVVDGLVSVTQRAWGLVAVRLQAVHG